MTYVLKFTSEAQKLCETVAERRGAKNDLKKLDPDIAGPLQNHRGQSRAYTGTSRALIPQKVRGDSRNRRGPSRSIAGKVKSQENRGHNQKLRWELTNVRFNLKRTQNLTVTSLEARNWADMLRRHDFEHRLATKPSRIEVRWENATPSLTSTGISHKTCAQVDQKGPETSTRIARQTAR